jgi:hypothetical protein
MFSFRNRRFVLTATGRYVLFGLVAYGLMSLAVTYLKNRPAQAAASQERDEPAPTLVQRDR